MTEALLIGAAAFGPLAHGCVEPWSLALLEILLLSMLLSREERAARPLLALPVIAIAVLGCCQWLNPAPLDGPSGWLPFTASSRETGRAVVLWAAFAALLLRTPAVLSSPAAKTRLAWTLALVGAVVAVVGAAQLAGGNTLVYGLRTVAYNRSPFGPYFNRGHAASFMAMCLCVGSGLFASRQAGRGRLFDRGMRPSEFFSSQACLGLLLALVAAGIVLTRNRGAVIGLALAGMGVAFWACGFLRSAARRWALRCGLAAAPAALAGAILLWPGSLGFPHGFQENSVAWRAEMYRGAWRLLNDFPVWGVGLGAVVSAFPAYKAAVVAGVVDHVHSDWLELPLQVGMAGTLACWAGLAGLAVSFWKRSRDRLPEELCLEAGALAGTLAFIGHGAIEFSFQIPANAVVFLTLLCWLAASPGEGLEERAGPTRNGATAPRPWRRWVLNAAVLGLMACAAYPVAGWSYAWRARGMPSNIQTELFKESYRWDPQPDIAYAIGYNLFIASDRDPRGKAPALREGLVFVREALAREPMSPYLTRLQGTYLASLGRLQDARPMLAVPR